MLLFTAQHTNWYNPHQLPSSAGFHYDIVYFILAYFKSLLFNQTLHYFASRAGDTVRVSSPEKERRLLWKVRPLQVVQIIPPLENLNVIL